LISSKASSSSSYSRSIKLLVAGTIRYGLLLAAATHRGINPFSRVALSSYSTSSYSFGGDDVDGIDEMDDPKIKKRAKWTDDLVTLR